MRCIRVRARVRVCSSVCGCIRAEVRVCSGVHTSGAAAGVTGGVHRFLVDDMRVDISVVNHDGWGAMHLAARRGCTQPLAAPWF